ncbi:MAG: hypothetical protein JWO98_480 [Frankiales bacterium]|nr:hypothetical protein [Frankiales bacterium]
MRDYPEVPVRVGHVEPVPRRIRGYIGATLVLDTVAARYVWEWPSYPQYYVPMADVTAGFLVDEGVEELRVPGPARLHGLRVGGRSTRGAAWVQTSGELADTVRFDWAALDSWFEEDEQVFVHPRSPYSRTDALRSNRTVRVEVDGVVLAESSSPVMVFETGLPTRYYLPRTDLCLDRLVPTDTVTQCPYKGRTSQYWSARIGEAEHRDIAWSYDFPTRQLLPIAGLVAFYNEKLDIFVDGRRLDRPVTHFSI